MSRRGSPTAKIAGRLFIAVRTAEGHVEQILEKLGFHSRTQVAAWMLHDKGAIKASERSKGNLGSQLTSFVGRRQETDDVARQLNVSRLVTLTGAGGCGKTRLALEVAAMVAERHPDGVWLVELAGQGGSGSKAPDGAGLAEAVVAALGVVDIKGLGPIATLREHLRPLQLLLVLDNCEHVVEQSAE